MTLGVTGNELSLRVVVFLEGRRSCPTISVLVPCLACSANAMTVRCIVSKWCTHKPVPLKTGAKNGGIFRQYASNGTTPHALSNRKMLITIAVNGDHPPGNLLVLEEKNRCMLAF